MGQLKKTIRDLRPPAVVSQLTAMQQAFVHGVVSGGLSHTESARQAGFDSYKSAAYRLPRLPHIAAAIKQERAKVFDTDLANVAANTLKEVMQDVNAPAAARVSAARTVLEVTRELGRAKEDPTDDKNLAEMTADELASLIDRWQGERAAIAKDVTPGVSPELDRAQDLAQLSTEF